MRGRATKQSLSKVRYWNLGDTFSRGEKSNKKWFDLLSLIRVAAMLATAPVGATAGLKAQTEEKEQADDARTACESLIDLEPPNTTITAAEYIINEPVLAEKDIRSRASQNGCRTTCLRWY